jgi:hypothetical protein
MTLSDALQSYESVIEDASQDGARVLLSTYVMMDVILKEAGFDDLFLFKFCSFHISLFTAEAYEWDNRREDGRIPKDMLVQFRETAHQLVEAYLQSKDEVTFRSLLKSIGAGGWAPALTPEERGDVTQFLLIVKELVSRHHIDHAGAVSLGIDNLIEDIDCTELTEDLSRFAKMAVDGLEDIYLEEREQNL